MEFLEHNNFGENKCLNSMYSTLPPCVFGPSLVGLMSEFVNHCKKESKPKQHIESLLRFLMLITLI